MQTIKARNMRDQAEYIIYAYQNFEAGKVGHNKWQVLSVVPEQEQALQTAHHFYESNDYKKIEVKKKIFDQKSKRYIASTLKTLEKKNYSAVWFVGALTAIALLPALFFVFNGT